MISYILRRALYMIPVLIGINAITLLLFYVVSEDPVLQHAGRNPSQETLQAKRHEFELDAPTFYSSDFLSGEDILKARRADRLKETIDQVRAAETGDQTHDRPLQRFINTYQGARPAQ